MENNASPLFDEDEMPGEEPLFVSAYFELLERYPDAANLACEVDARKHKPFALALDSSSYNDFKSSAETDENGLPSPKPYEGERFSVYDYKSSKYAEASTIEEAITMRGDDAFFSKLEPTDMDSVPSGFKKLGIASLWSQFTWYEADECGRNIEEELVAANLGEGDVLVLGCAPDNLPEGQNWMEVSDLGFGFYHDGLFLPFTPFHDYDQDFFLDIIKALKPNEWIECIIRSSTCNGGDAGEVLTDSDFYWRVYSCDITVYKISANSSKA